MAFLGILFKANEAKNILDELEVAKLNAKRAREGLPPLEIEGWCSFFTRPLRRLRDVIFPWVFFTKGVPTPKTFWKRLWFNGTRSNERMKMCCGYLCGMLLTAMCFYLMLVEFQIDWLPMLVLTFICASVLPFGLALSHRSRCVMLLTFPSLFTDKGQALVLAYMLTIVTNGPVENFNYNTQALATSALCAQQKVMESRMELLEYVRQPLLSIERKLKEIVAPLQDMMNDLERKMEAISENLQNIADEANKIRAWYKEVTNFCNEKHSNMEANCREAATIAREHCPYKWSGNFFMEGICEIVMGILKDVACDNVLSEFREGLCSLEIPEIDLGIKKKIKETVEERKRKIREFFYFDITFYKNSSLAETKSKNYTSILDAIKSELYAKVKVVTDIIKVTQCTLFVFSAMVLVMAMWYLFKYQSALNHDNHYLNDFIHDIDTKRMMVHDKVESVFPLTWKEELIYIYPLSYSITVKEGARIIANLLLMMPILINLLLAAACDIGLWWVLELLSRFFRITSDDIGSGTFNMIVSGNGPMAEFYDKIMSMADSVTSLADSSMWQCAPHPREPDWSKYRTIRTAVHKLATLTTHGNFVIYLVLICVLQGYILRLRHLICNVVYPERAHERAVYLYNEILKLRGSFSTYLRRQVERSLDSRVQVEKVSLCHRLGASFPSLRPLLNAMGYAQKYCTACGLAGSVSDVENFTHCQTYGCTGVYCLACYETINNMCTVCMHVVNYGELSDASIEIDSSSEDDEDGSGSKDELAECKKMQAQGRLMKNLLGMLRNPSNENELQPTASESKADSKKDSNDGNVKNSGSDGDDEDENESDDETISLLHSGSRARQPSWSSSRDPGIVSSV